MTCSEALTSLRLASLVSLIARTQKERLSVLPTFRTRKAPDELVFTVANFLNPACGPKRRFSTTVAAGVKAGLILPLATTERGARPQA